MNSSICFILKPNPNAMRCAIDLFVTVSIFVSDTLIDLYFSLLFIFEYLQHEHAPERRK